MVDYRINLAKSVTSTPEQRRSFYNRMILYLALCAAGMVYVAYLASSNVTRAYKAGRERRTLVEAHTAASDFSKGFFRNPEKAYDELNRYAGEMANLQAVLAQRTHFLPVLNELFSDFPEEVALESLTASAENQSIGFILVGSGKLIREQQELWKKDAKLDELVEGTAQVKSEQRIVNGQSIPAIEFECILKK